MSTAAYKKSLKAQLDNRSTRIDKGQLKVRLRSTAVKIIITGAPLLNQRYPPQDRKIQIRKEIRWVAFFAVLILLNLPALASAQSSWPGTYAIAIIHDENMNNIPGCSIGANCQGS